MPIYRLNGEVYDIPEDVVADFEKDNPSATVTYHAGDDEYEIPVSERDAFLKDFPEAQTESTTLAGKPQDTVKTTKNGGGYMPSADEMKGFQNAIGQAQQTVRGNQQSAKRIDARQKNARKTNYGLTPDTPKLGQNRKVVATDPHFDLESGQMESTYITEQGNEYQTREVADIEQNAVDIAKRRMSLPGQLEDAYAERERLQAEIDAETQRIGYGQSPERSYAPQVPGSIPRQSAERLSNDRLQTLLAAQRQNEERITALEAERDDDGGTQFWRGFLDAAKNPSTWTFGATDFQNMTQLMRIKGKVDGGEELTDDEETLLKNTMANGYAQQMFGENRGFMYRAGGISMQALPFVAEFMATGGFSSLTQMGANAGTRVAEKFALEGLKKTLLRNTGVAMGDIASSFIMANTTGAARTGADIMERTIGHVTVDEEGNYQFEGGKSLGRSIYEGEVASTLEYYTEKLGEHLQLGNWIAKGADKMGLSKLSKAVGYLSNSKMLNAGGIQDYPSEVVEEQANLLLNAILVGDNNFNGPSDPHSVINPKTQIDIWGGMLFSIGLMQAPRLAHTGYNAAGYYAYKHGLDVADTKAASVFGADKWQMVKDEIDNSDNENISEVLASVVTGDMSSEQKEATMFYADNLLKMRGFNNGMMADVRNEASAMPQHAEQDAETFLSHGIDQGYQQGHEAQEPDEKKMFVDEANEAEARLSELFTEQDVQFITNTEPMNAINIMLSNRGSNPGEWNDDEIAAVVDYYQKQARAQGVMDAAADDVEYQVARANAEVDANTHKALNQMIMAESGGEQFYIVGGDVALLAGETSEHTGYHFDYENTGDALVVRNAETGEISVKSPQMLSLNMVSDPNQLKMLNETQLRQEVTQLHDDEITFGSPAQEVFQLNDTVALNDGQGNVIEGEIGMMPNVIDGAYVVYTSDGRALQFTGDELNKMIVRHNEQEVERATAMPQPTEQAATQPVEDIGDAGGERTLENANEADGSNPPAPGDAGGERTLENANEADGSNPPAPNVEPGQPQSALDRIPVFQDASGKPILNKKGKKQYQWHKASVDDTADALTELAGGDMLMARDTATDLINNARGKLEKIRKQKPRGDDPIEIAESRAEIRRQEQEQQDIISHWQKVNQTIQNRMRVEAAAIQQRTEQAKSEEQKAREAEEARIRQEKLDEIERQRLRESIEKDHERRNKEYEPLVQARKEMADDSDAMAILQDTEPRDLREWVSSLLRPHSILWQDASESEVGLRSELGLQRSDMQRFMTLLGNKENGAVPFGKAVLDIYEGLPEGLKEQYNDQDVRNVVLDLFQSAANSREMMNLTAENRIAEAKSMRENRMAQEAEWEMEAWCEHYHLTPEERATFEDFISTLEPPYAVEESIINQIIADNEQDRTSARLDRTDVPGGNEGEPEGGESQVQGTVEAAGDGTHEEGSHEAAEAATGESAVSGDEVAGRAFSEENTVGSEVAAEWLIGSGQNAINSTDYLLKALSGVFPKTTQAIEAIRRKYAQQFASSDAAEISDFVNSGIYSQVISEIRNAIESAYPNNTEARYVFDTILQHPTGLPMRIGLDISRRIDNLDSPVASVEQLKTPDLRDAVRPNSPEFGMSEANVRARVDNMIGRSLTEEEADDLILESAARAEAIPEFELTPENWEAEFGNGILTTPIGDVKLSDNQYSKSIDKGRSKEVGMIKPTLTAPDFIIEVESEAKDGNAERPTSYLFVKAFIGKNGEKQYFFKSVTVQRDGMEVNVSNHFDRPKRLRESLEKGKLLYRLTGGAQTEQSPATVSVTTPQTVPGVGEMSADSESLFATNKGLAGLATDKSSSKGTKKSGNRQGKLGKTSSSEEISSEEAKVNTKPTEGQKEAGNYQKGHINVDGYDITIENPKGSIRRGTDANGTPWETEMHNTYGYIRGTEGVDGDHIDVFLSENPTGGNVFVIDQISPDTGAFDEHKVMYGFSNEEEARQAYLSNYAEGWQGLGKITEVSRGEFKKWVESSHRKTKPFAEYKSVKKAALVAQHTEQATREAAGTVANASGNRLVSDERYEQLKDRMRKKLLGQMNMGIDPEILAIGTEMAVYHIEKGARAFAEYAKGMIADLGDAIRPYLKAFYNGARDLPEMSDFVHDMDEYGTVQAFDVFNFDKQQAPTPVEKAQQVVSQKKADKEAAEAVKKILEIAKKDGSKKSRKNSQQVQVPSLFDMFEEESNPAQTESNPAKQETPAKSTSFLLSKEEKDKEGNRMYERNGTIDLWNASPLFTKARRQDAPIRLSDRNMKHIISRHSDRLDSEEKVFAFLDNVFANATKLRRARGRGMFVVVENDNTDSVAMIRLMPSGNGDYYNIDTAGYYRKNKWKESEEVIADLSEPGQSDAAADTSKPQIPDENGREPINTEAQQPSSEGKGTKNIDTIQEKDKESDDKLLREGDYAHAVALSGRKRSPKEQPKPKTAWWSDPNRPQSLDPSDYQTYTTDEAKAYFANFVAPADEKGKVFPDFTKWSHPNLAYVTAAAWDGAVIPKEELMQIPEIQEAESRGKKTGSLNISGQEKQQHIQHLLDAEHGSAVMEHGKMKKINGEADFSGPVKQERKAFIVIGRPAGGKSSVFANELSFNNGARIVDSDVVKPWLRGFDDGYGAGYVQNASASVADAAMMIAAERGDNMVIPRIGGSSVIDNTVIPLIEKGYDVQLFYNDVSEQTSIMRAASRFAEEGRYLSLQYLTTIENKISKTFSKFAEKKLGEYYDERNSDERPSQWNVRTNDIPLVDGRSIEGRTEPSGSGTGESISSVVPEGGRRGRNQAEQGNETVRREEPIFSYVEWKSNDVAFGEKPKEIWNSKSGKPMPGTVKQNSNEGEQKVSRKPDTVGQGAEQASGATERTGAERSSEQNRAERSGSGHSVKKIAVIQQQTEQDLAGKPQGTFSHKNKRNNVGERGKDYAPLSPKARFNANVQAIKILRQLVDEGVGKETAERTASKEEMEALRQYSGWGGMGTFFNDETSAENKILRDLLSEDEYNDAALSIKTAYYTPATVIDTLWDLAKAAGFKGGNVLEGSAGIGNIIGQMPLEMSRRSDIEAVELDAISGNILKILYPDARVHIQGFQDTVIPNGTVDLAITNVPFAADISVKDKVDKDLSRQFRQLHDFCIAKNIRKLKEGGIGIFITTSGTLDKSTKLREWIPDEGQSDVIGAFRLHKKTFGGANVTSDIIVVRKRVGGKASEHRIDISKATPLKVGTYEDKAGNDHQVSMVINDYFKKHPEMMAGEMAFAYEKGETYRPGSYGLYPVEGKNQEKMLAEFVKSMEVKAEVAVIQQQTEREQISNQLTAEKEGRMLIDENGRLCVSERGMAVPLVLNATKVKGQTKEQCFKDYQDVQKAVDEVLQQQLNDPDDASLKPKLIALNKAFDKFVKRYGNLHKNTSIAFLRNDIDFPSFLALENYSESKDMNGKVTVTTRKAPLFSQRVLGFKTEPQPTNIKDAVIASIFRSNTIDVAWITERLNSVGGKTANHTEQSVRDEILRNRLGFEDPSTGQLEIRYKYLSGNVREKLAVAEGYNTSGETTGRYVANVEELRKAVPMDIPSHLIEFSLGSSWIPMEIYNDYLKETYDLVNAKLTHIEGSWVLDEGSGYRNEKNRAAGVYSEQFRETIYGHQLVLAALNNRPVKVQKQVSEGYGSSKTTRTVTDQAATQACAVRVDEIKDEFKQYAKKKMQDNPELSAQVERIYNEKFNALVPMQIDDEFLPDVFEGANMNIHLYGHQKRGVMRGLTSPTMLAHEVGTGKSFTLISTAMEMKRLGTAKKPMVVVQNATVAQMTADAKLLYPNARVLSLSEKDRSAEGRRSFYAKIKYNDWDLIIVPQSTFERIPDSPERELQFIQEKIDEKKHVIEAAEQSGMDEREIERLRKELEKIEQEYGDTFLDNGIAGKTGERTKGKKKDAKQEAASLEKAKVKAQEQLDRAVDDVQYFDDLGVDALLIDEAHEYKHLGFQTSIGRGIKGIDPSYSKKCAGLYNKTRSVFEKAGWKNVVFATGTPISNTAAEIWTFMKYLMPADVMRANDIYYFDDFVHNFGNISQMLEFATSGKFKENTRFAAYVNKPELIRIWSQVADTVLTKEVGAVNEKIPEQEGGKDQDVFLPQSPSLIRIMNAVRKELERFENMTGKEKKENSSIPLTMYGIAKRAAIDPRLVDAEAPDEPLSKTNAAVKEIVKDLEATKDYKGTVAVFCDNQNRLGKTGGKTAGHTVVEFNIYDDMKAKLIQADVPESQIAIIKSGMSITAKQKVFDAVNSGDIRVVLGSTQTLGTGVNMQERLHLLIHMDAPDRPMDYTQRNGRIKRQGNLHKTWGKTIRVLRFGVEDSLDVTAYQRLKTKSGFIDSIMDGKGALLNNQVDRTVEEEEEGLFDNPVAVLSGSQYALKKNQAERELRKFQSKRAQWEADQVYVSNALRQNKATLEYTQSQIAEEEKQLAHIRNLFPDGKVKTVSVEGVKVNLAGKTSEHTELGKVIKEKINEPVNATVKKLRENQIYNNEVLPFTIELDGRKVEFKVSVEREAVYENGKMRTVIHKYTTYDSPSLGIDSLMKSAKSVGEHLNDILDEVVSGRDNTDRIEAYKASIERVNRETEQLQQRVGMPFQYEKELDEARKHVDEYTELMKQELQEKEAKYSAQQEESDDGGFDLHKTEDVEEEDEDVRYSADEDWDEEMLNRDMEGMTSQELLLSLSQKDDYERNETVNELIRRVRAGEARIVCMGQEIPSAQSSDAQIAGTIVGLWGQLRLREVANEALRGLEPGRSEVARRPSAQVEAIASDCQLAIVSWAKASGAYISRGALEAISLDKAVWKSGAESDVYRTSDGKKLVKFTETWVYFQNPLLKRMDSIALGNAEGFVPSTVLGFSVDDKGHLMTVVEQDFVDGVTIDDVFDDDGPAQVNAYLNKYLERVLGLENAGRDENGNQVHKKDGIIYKDIHGANVLMDRHGKLHIIDGYVSREGDDQKERAPGFSIEDAEDFDTRHRDVEQFKNGETFPIHTTYNYSDNVMNTSRSYSTDLMPDEYASKARLLDALRRQYPDYWVSMEDDTIRFESWRHALHSGETAMSTGRDKKAHSSYIERKTRNAVNAINEMAQRMGLDVEVLTTTEGLKGKKARSKGWFNPKTGKITLVLPNNSNLSDLINTLLHEGVAHYGLRKLFGKNFDTFLDNIYNNVSPDVRAIIDASMKRNKWSQHEATEEYLARLAERTDFERATQQGWWSKIKEFFFEMLGRIGFNISLSDNDLRYILWRSYENLLHPGKYRNIFEEAKDTAMQAKLRVGKFARERERLQRTGRVDTSRVAEAVDALNEEIKAMRDADDMGLLFRDDDDDIAKSVYEDFVTKESFKFKENWQDSMASLKAIQKAIATETGRVATGAEDAYRFENRMHGRAKNMAEKYDYNFYRPMLKAFHDVCKYCHISIEHGMDYLISKSGLERNVYYAFRDAAKAKITDEINEERNELDKQYAKGRMSEDDYKAKKQELEEREQTGVDDFMQQVRSMYAYQHAKQQYENGDINYTEYLRIIETVIRGQLKKRGRDTSTNETDNYYDEQQKDYSGLTETFAKDMYDEAQNVKKRAQRAIDPDERKTLWHEYDEKMRQAYITARQVAEDQVFAAESGGAAAVQHRTELWRRINAATKETLKHSYESGLIDRNNYNKVRDMFDWYIPLRGWDEDKASDVYTYMGRDNVFSPAVKKVWGRQSKAENPLAYIGNIAVSTILSGHRNQMKLHFLNYVMNNPTSLVSISESWYENIAPDDEAPVWVLRTADTAGKSADEIAQIVHDFNEEMEQKQRDGKAMPVRGRLRLDVHATQGQKAEHVVEVQRAGRTYQLYINGDPKAAQALNGTNMEETNSRLREVIRNTNRKMAAFFTSKNPAFVVSNLSRDLNMAGASVAINEGKEYNARFIANVAKVLRPRLGESSKWMPASKQPTGLMPSLMRKWKNGSLNQRDETERLFGEFMDEGGETGFVNMLSIDSFKERMQKEIREMNGSSLFGAKAKVKECSTHKALRLLGDTFEFYNRCAEDATRFIVYMTSRQMGKTLEESIADAKDVTLNFNRKGTGGKGADWMPFSQKDIQDLFIFVNPAIQALANMYRMAAHHPLKFGAVTAAFVAGGALLPIINQWLLQLLGDDDDKQAYWNLPPWVRKNNLVFWIPGTKNFVTIPLAQEFRVFYGVGEMLSSAVMDHPVDKWGLEVFSSVADLVPINPTGNGGNLMVDFAPTMVQPLMQVGENVDFTGKPIWRENQGNKHAPMYSKAYVSTPQWMVKVSECLNTVTGGNEGRKGWVERNAPIWGAYINNPAVWNHLLQGYFGGMYNTIAKSADVVATTASGEWPKIYQTPVINRFLNRPVERDNGGVLGNEYYSLINERDEVMYEVRTWKRKVANLGGETAERNEAQKHLEELMESERYKRAEVITHYEKILKELKAGERAIKEGAGHNEMDLHDIHEGMNLFKVEMLEELAAIEEGKKPLETAIEKFNSAQSFAEKNKLRLRIERLMMEDANGKTVGHTQDVEKALAYLRGEDVESSKTSEQYLMLATGEDMAADARIRAAKARIKQVTDEYKKMLSNGRIDEAATFREKHAKWFAAENIINGQQRGIATNKKLLGKGYDSNIMQLIRAQRERMLEAIEELL